MAGALSPGDLFGGYRIDALAGSGGMGVVYRATQLELERTVALKLIDPARADEDGFRARFRRETRLLASIDHPHVIPVYEAGTSDGRMFVSMRWVDGVDLSGVLRHCAGLDAGRALGIVSQVASALDAVHGCGLVHRDVKPANVLLEHDDRAFLSDFGVGKRIAASDDLTAPGQWLGTLDYIAPEQLLGDPPDARTDVYSLGCVLFETLIGRAPYHRDTAPEKVSAHLRDPVPSTTQLRPDLPAGIDDVIARALAKDPAQRYRTAGELARAAAGALEDRGTRASPPTATTPSAPATVGATLRHDDGASAPPPAGGSRRPRRSPRAVAFGVLAMTALIAAGVAIGTGGDAPPPAKAAPDPVPCAPATGGRVDCPFYLTGDGRSGGTPVLDASGTQIGHLSQGRHRVVCQSVGRVERYGPYHNQSWARVVAGNRRRGWANAVYGTGGDNNGAFSGARPCLASDGQPPGGVAQRNDGSSAPNQAASIVAPPGLSVPQCWLFRGTAALPAGQTLLFGVKNLDNGGPTYFDAVTGWRTAVGRGDWSQPQYFGSGSSSVGQQYAVSLIAITTSALDAELAKHGGEDWSATAPPRGTTTLETLLVHRRAGAGDCPR